MTPPFHKRGNIGYGVFAAPPTTRKECGYINTALAVWVTDFCALSAATGNRSGIRRAVHRLPAKH